MNVTVAALGLDYFANPFWKAHCYVDSSLYKYASDYSKSLKAWMNDVFDPISGGYFLVVLDLQLERCCFSNFVCTVLL